MKNYKKTKLACYLGFITQAVAANFAPLLFLKFHTDYNISLGNIAMISTSFFFTQLLVDLFCAKYVDKIGYRVCIVASEVCSAAGLVGLAFLPEIIPSPFIGIIISVILYAIGSGLIEVLGSPIVEACPFENKEATMSLLHSFYCWGAVGTILVSTVFFLLFGIGSWKWLAVIFALIPAINIINFATCPIESLVEEGQGMEIRKLFSNPMFLIAIVMISIYDIIPAELNKQNKKFVFTMLNKELKFDRYENSFLWLKDAGVALPVYNVEAPVIPLKASKSSNVFRLFSNDTGLLTSAYPAETKLELINKNSEVNNGAHFENAVAQQLTANGLEPYFCKKKNIGELDVLVEMDGKVVPIEVKSGKAYKAHKSLDNFMKISDYHIEKAYVLSVANMEQEGSVVYLPIYMCYLLKERKIGKLIVDLDMEGL